MKNKICIVTWFGGLNYGTNLQAYALLEKLRILGYEAYIKGKIRWNFNYLLHPIFFIKRIEEKIQINNTRQVLKNDDEEKEIKFKNFDLTYLTKLNTNGQKEWKQVEEEFVAFVTGSDQVWNPHYFQRTMMLDFVKSKKLKKIAYAPSIGVDELSKKTRNEYRRLLASYNAIGMRESKATEIISEISPVPVMTVLDPTLLLTSRNWDKLLENAQIDSSWEINNPYVLCYFVGDRNDYGNYIELIKEKTGMKCFIIPMNNNESKYGDILTGVGPIEFIWLIKNAGIICTDSFHATVFSILYQKEFYVLKRFNDSSKLSQNGRLYEILSTYKLENRLITNETEFIRNRDIDYGIVEKILIDKRTFSENFLTNSLNEG